LEFVKSYKQYVSSKISELNEEEELEIPVLEDVELLLDGLEILDEDGDETEDIDEEDEDKVDKDDKDDEDELPNATKYVDKFLKISPLLIPYLDFSVLLTKDVVGALDV
jgi:ABC-type Zn2+ transport system substrate-binding protein/surface adhesin